MPESLSPSVDDIWLLVDRIFAENRDVEARIRSEVIPIYVERGAGREHVRVLELLAERELDYGAHYEALQIYAGELKPLYVDDFGEDEGLLPILAQVAYLIAHQVSADDGAAVLFEERALFLRHGGMERWVEGMEKIARFQVSIGDPAGAVRLLQEAQPQAEGAELRMAEALVDLLLDVGRAEEGLRVFWEKEAPLRERDGTMVERRARVEGAAGMAGWGVSLG